MKKNKNLISLDQFIDNEIGAIGTRKRTKFDAGYEAFKLGVLIQKAKPFPPTYTTPGPSHSQSHSPSGK
jgi:hypothetical protein